MATIAVKSRVSLLFEPILQIRKSIFDIEEALQGDFLPPNLIQIPDDAPNEIPRIEMRSKNGHSLLQISQIRLDFVTNYDEEYQHDFSKCFKYIQSKSKLIEKAVEVIKPDIAITALSFTVQHPIKVGDEVDNDVFVTDFSQDTFKDCMTEKDIIDFKINTTARIDDDLFMVTTLNNYRRFTVNGALHTPYPVTATLNKADSGVEYDLEVNDKNRLSSNRGRSLGLTQVGKFLDIISNKINAVPCLLESQEESSVFPY